MFITKFTIRNFKSFHEVTLNFNSDLNIFTGVNNSGKTSILEALALWEECFVKLAYRATKASTKLGIRAGDYRFGHESHNYFEYADTLAVRSPGFADLFHNLNPRNEIQLVAEIKKGASLLTLGFRIKAVSRASYDITVMRLEGFSYSALNAFFETWPTPLNVVFASPVAVRQVEHFQTLPSIRHQVASHESMGVFRNRIYQLSKQTARFEEFQTVISEILFESPNQVRIKIISDEQKEMRLRVLAEVGNKDIAKDISLLGSGALQIVEVLLGYFESESDLNLILLDEPDSHIHRTVQQRLLKTLIGFSSKTQIFLTTHNESLIRDAEYRHIFLLNGYFCGKK